VSLLFYFSSLLFIDCILVTSTNHCGRKCKYINPITKLLIPLFCLDIFFFWPHWVNSVHGSDRCHPSIGPCIWTVSVRFLHNYTLRGTSCYYLLAKYWLYIVYIV
jgi:hypothetical protein